MTIGEAIRKAREDKGYSRSQLSIKAGVPYITIRHWETDRSIPRVDLLICVADALGVTLDDLVGRTRRGNN